MATGAPAAIQMKGNETFKLAIRSLTDVSLQVLNAEGLTPADVDLFIPHQANKRIPDAVGDRLGIPKVASYDDLVKLGKEVVNRGYNALKTNVLLFGDGNPRVRNGGFGRGSCCRRHSAMGRRRLGRDVAARA
mgnify:CR=1 FL=1